MFYDPGSWLYRLKPIFASINPTQTGSSGQEGPTALTAEFFTVRVA